MNKQISSTHFSFETKDEILSATIAYNSSKTTPSVVFLHGAGTANKERVSYLTTQLAEKGFSSLSFDFSGHGRSTGNLIRSSLNKRLSEALAAIQYLDISNGLTVVGSSMGAHIAVNLLDYIEIRNLILFCPALYSSLAEDKEFNQGFSEVLRRKDSWKDSVAFAKLENFKGNLLIIIGKEDTVIPTELIKKIDQVSINVQKKMVMTVSGATHQLHTFIEKNNSLKVEIGERIAELIK